MGVPYPLPQHGRAVPPPSTEAPAPPSTEAPAPVWPPSSAGDVFRTWPMKPQRQKPVRCFHLHRPAPVWPQRRGAGRTPSLYTTGETGSRLHTPHTLHRRAGACLAPGAQRRPHPASTPDDGRAGRLQGAAAPPRTLSAPDRAAPTRTAPAGHRGTGPSLAIGGRDRHSLSGDGTVTRCRGTRPSLAVGGRGRHSLSGDEAVTRCRGTRPSLAVGGRDRHSLSGDEAVTRCRGTRPSLAVGGRGRHSHSTGYGECRHNRKVDRAVRW
jgi:hypothetical protein